MIRKKLREQEILTVEAALSKEGLIKTSPDNYNNFYKRTDDSLHYKAYWYLDSSLIAITESERLDTYLYERL